VLSVELLGEPQAMTCPSLRGDLTMKIKVVKVPGGVSTVELSVENATVADLKELLGLNDNQEIRVDGEKVSDSDELEDNDTVSVAAKIKGAVA